MSRNVATPRIIDSISLAVKTRDNREFFKALEGVVASMTSVPIRDLPESLRMLRVLMALHEAIAYHQFKLGAGMNDEHEQMIAWSADGAGVFAAEAARFCRQIGADLFARHLDRLIGLYPGGRLPNTLEKIQHAAERIPSAAVNRVHTAHAAAVSDLGTALRRWLRTNQDELARQIEATGLAKKRTRAFARAIASAYGGQLKAKESTWDEVTLPQFLVSGSRGGRPLVFQVFDGGCIVEGPTSRKPAVGIALNCSIDGIDRRVRDIASEPMPTFRTKYLEGGKEFDPPAVTALRDQLRALWDDERSRAALVNLRLRPDEPLLLIEKPMYSAGPPRFYLMHRSADLAELERRIDLLGDVFPPVREGWDRPKRITDTAHGIRIGRGKSAVPSRHRFGGMLDNAPRCGNCRAPVHLILTIDTRDPALGLPDIGRASLPVLYCLNCMSWKPLYVDYSTTALRIIGQAKEERTNEEPWLDERAIHLTLLKSAHTSASKVGGVPKWLQGPDIPDCVRCREPMTFLAQLRSLPDMSFDDDGMLYAFICPGCKVSATFIQSH